MTALWLRILWVSVTTSAVLLPLLLCVQQIGARYRAKSCYLLWLLLCLRLLLPVELPLPAPAVTVELPPGVLTPAVEHRPAVSDPAAPAPAPADSPLSLSDAAAGVWCIGMCGVLVWHMTVYFTVRRRLERDSRQDARDRILLQTLGGQFPVLRCGTDTPMTMGLLCPVILLPEDTAGQDLPMILRHELCHLRRGDLWYKALFLLCCAVHWFNPLVWKLGRVAGDTLELCCDETVVAGQDECFRRCYGQVLLRSAAGHDPALSTSFGSGDLKGRLMNLFITKKNGAALVCAAMLAAWMMGSLVGCGTASAQGTPDPSAELTASSAAPSPQEREAWLWPVEGAYRVSALYGTRTHPITGATSSHTGLDIVAEKGTLVLCASAGTVSQADFDPVLGNYVLVDHGDDRLSLYAGLDQTDVSAGEDVARGQAIGTVGQSGASTGPHLHLELRDTAGNCYDPMNSYPDVELALNP